MAATFLRKRFFARATAGAKPGQSGYNGSVRTIDGVPMTKNTGRYTGLAPDRFKDFRR